MNTKQVVSAAGFLAFGRVVNISTQFAFNALLVRLLLKQEVGDFFLTFSLVSFLSLIVTYGSENIAIKKFLELKTQERPVKSSSKQLLFAFLLMNLLTIFLVVILVYILYTFNIIQFYNMEYSISIISVLLFWIWAQGLCVMLTEIFRAFSEFFLTALSSGVLINVLNLALLIGFYAFGTPPSFDKLLTLISFNAAVVAIWYIFLALRLCISFDKSNIDKSGIDKNNAEENSSTLFTITKTIIRNSTPSFLNKLGLYLTILADLWLMSMFFSKEVVADYAIAAKLAVSASIFFSVTNGLVPIFIAKFKKHGAVKTEQILRSLATSVALPSMGLLLLLLIKSDDIITLIFGSSYVSASSFLGILLLAQVVNLLVGSCGYLLIMKGKNEYLMKISVTSGVLAISLTLACMELDLGSLSIAWSFCLAAIFRNVATYIVTLKLCGVNTAIYLNPVSFFKSIKMIRLKLLSRL